MAGTTRPPSLLTGSRDAHSPPPVPARPLHASLHLPRNALPQRRARGCNPNRTPRAHPQRACSICEESSHPARALTAALAFWRRTFKRHATCLASAPNARHAAGAMWRTHRKTRRARAGERHHSQKKKRKEKGETPNLAKVWQHTRLSANARNLRNPSPHPSPTPPTPSAGPWPTTRNARKG